MNLLATHVHAVVVSCVAEPPEVLFTVTPPEGFLMLLAWNVHLPPPVLVMALGAGLEVPSLTIKLSVAVVSVVEAVTLKVPAFCVVHV